MSRKILYILLLAGIYITSCTKKAPNTDVVVYDVDYNISSRSIQGLPENEATFTFVSYKRLNDANDYEFTPNYHTNLRPEGRYVYFEDQDAYQGIFQPCTVDPDNNYDFVQRNLLEGQGLLNGIYKTICFHPGIYLEPLNNIQHLVYQRNQERYASHPFVMQVSGYQIFDLDDNLPIYDLRSKIVFDIVQLTTSEFTIETPALINAAFWGWYHPLLQKITLGYNQTDKYDLYEKGEFEDGTDESYETLVISGDLSDPNVDIYKTGDTGVNQVIYTTGLEDNDGLFFFPNNYSTDKYAQPSFEFDLNMNGSKFPISVPLSIEMKKNTRYKFKISVESEIVRVSFKVIPWTNNGYDDGIGGDNEELLGIWRIVDWENITPDPEDIG